MHVDNVYVVTLVSIARILKRFIYFATNIVSLLQYQLTVLQTRTKVL